MRLEMYYCVHAPNGAYFGHKRRSLKAERWVDAEPKAHAFLETLAGKGQWEYRIVEVKEETGFRIYDTRQHRRL